MEPSLNNAGLVVANTDWECSVMVGQRSGITNAVIYLFLQTLRAKTFVADLVPPSRHLPPPTFFESTHPPGLEVDCDALFSFFAPAFTGQRWVGSNTYNKHLCSHYSSTKPHRSPSILVSGPPGVGKRAVIQAVAKRCRMSVVEVSEGH